MEIDHELCDLLDNLGFKRSIIFYPVFTIDFKKKKYYIFDEISTKDYRTRKCIEIYEIRIKPSTKVLGILYKILLFLHNNRIDNYIKIKVIGKIYLLIDCPELIDIRISHSIKVLIENVSSHFSGKINGFYNSHAINNNEYGKQILMNYGITPSYKIYIRLLRNKITVINSDLIQYYLLDGENNTNQIEYCGENKYSITEFSNIYDDFIKSTKKLTTN